MLLALVSVFIAKKISQKEAVAPTAPESKPSALEWIGDPACQQNFVIKAPTLTPTRAPTATPALVLTNTPTPEPVPVCVVIKLYVFLENTWVQKAPQEIENLLSTGDTIRMSVVGSGVNEFQKARFIINGGTPIETRAMWNDEFYIDYNINTAGTFVVQAQLWY